MASRPYPKHTASTTSPAAPQAGDEWWNTSTNRYYKYAVVSGMAPQWVEIAQPSLITSSANTWIAAQTFTTDVVHGYGDNTGSPLGLSIRGPNAFGTDINGGSITLSGGSGTGAGTGGDIIFSTAASGSNGSSLNVSTEKLRITNKGALRFTGGISGYIDFTPSLFSGAQSYTLPSGYPGANGYVLSSTTLGTLSWTAMATGVSTSSANTWTATQTFAAGLQATQFVRGFPGTLTANSLLPSTHYAGTGALTSVGSAATGNNPYKMACDPTGRFVFVPNFSSNTVQAYTINQTTGALTSVGTAVTGTSPRGVACAPTGKFAYVVNDGSNTVQAYTINQTTGALTSVGTTATGTQPFGVACDPMGRFVFVTNATSSTVQAYTINQTTGALTSVGTASTGSSPYGVACDPTGRFVFTANNGGSSVGAYSINQTTGALTSIGNVSAGSQPFGVACDPTGRFVCVGNVGSATAQLYTIDQSSGSLTSVGAVAAGTNAMGVAFDPTGRFVFVTNYGAATVQTYAINQYTGALTSIGTTGAGTNPLGVVCDPTGRFAFVTNNGAATVQAYRISNFGTGSGYFLDSVILGSGDGTGTITGGTLRAPTGSGTNIAGGSLTFSGGISTGSGAGGDIIFNTTPAGSSGATANTAVERIRLTGAGVLNIKESDVALDKAVVTQQVARVVGFNPTYSGMNGSPTLTYALTIPAATNRILIAYQFSNQSGTFATAPTYPKGGVTTSMTVITGFPVTSNAYMSAWYMVNPDSSGTITFNSNGCAYYGTGVDCFYNIDTTNPVTSIATAGASVGNTSVSITVTGMVSAHNLVIGYFDGWGKNPVSATTGLTQQWAVTGDASWRTYLYQMIPTLGSTSQTMSLTMTATNDSYTFSGFALKGSTSASPVALGTTASALNLTFGGASTVTLPTATSALNFASNLLNFDTTNSRIGIGTITPAYKLEAYGSIATRPAATNDALVFSGRAGGASSYAVTLTPTTLSANQTITVPNETGTLLTTASTIPGSQSGSGSRTFAFMGA